MTGTYTLTRLNLPDLHRHFVGFENMFEDINRTFEMAKQDNYPPYNISKIGENQYLIEIAVAGFRENELDMETKANEYGQRILVVRGERLPPEKSPEYLHRGLAARNFERSFTLNENMEILGASVELGVLNIRLEHKIPEAMKAKKVAITFSK